MAAVKETMSPLISREVETTTLPRPAAARPLVSVPKTVASSKGLLRDLLANDATLGLAIGGHRGMGENLGNSDATVTVNMWRENSIKSFLAAHQRGARFVEMDVQVTRDGVPVIWHDDLIVYGPPSNPTCHAIAELDYEAFSSLGPQKLKENEKVAEWCTLCRQFNYRTNELLVASSAYPVPWHCLAEDVLPSLHDVLVSLPIDLGLNLEIKMATPKSLERTPHDEIERMTQPIVKMLMEDAKHQQGRQIVISSFDPDICTEVRRKLQVAGLNTIPVMFLTTGGADLHADVRRTSIGGAIDFCVKHGLKGLVVDTSQLRTQSHFIQLARHHELQMMTYGLENDDIEWLTEQWKLGVHGAIVDNVSHIIPHFCLLMRSPSRCDPNNEACSVAST